MQSTLISSNAIGLTLDNPIDFAFSPRLSEQTSSRKIKGDSLQTNLQRNLKFHSHLNRIECKYFHTKPKPLIGVKTFSKNVKRISSTVNTMVQSNSAHFVSIKLSSNLIRRTLQDTAIP